MHFEFQRKTPVPVARRRFVVVPEEDEPELLDAPLDVERVVDVAVARLVVVPVDRFVAAGVATTQRTSSLMMITRKRPLVGS